MTNKHKQQPTFNQRKNNDNNEKRLTNNEIIEVFCFKFYLCIKQFLIVLNFEFYFFHKKRILYGFYASILQCQHIVYLINMSIKILKCCTLRFCATKPQK